MTTAADDDHDTKKGGAAPVFTGNMADFEDWEFKVEMWIHGSKTSKDRLAAILFNAQTNDQVMRKMKSNGKEKMKTAEGMEAMMQFMRTKYAKPQDSLAWPSFDAFDDTFRHKDESSEAYINRFESNYETTQRYDSELNASDRMLAMMCLKKGCVFLGKTKQRFWRPSLLRTRSPPARS